jgi:threonine dehydratase
MAPASLTIDAAETGSGLPLPLIDPHSGLPLPTLGDVFRARRVLASFLPRTPLLAPPALAERLGCEIFVKCENLQPIGAFKVRGGLFLLSELTPEERGRGVVTASTGNHGQSIAYAARIFGSRATIFMPEAANPLKVAAMRRLGAEIIFHGEDFDACREAAEAEAASRGAHYVHPANEPRLIAGVATATLEIMEDVPDLEVLIVPTGGGSGLSGACLVGKSVNPGLRVVGVQARGAPAIYESWRQGRPVTLPHAETFAEGLATRVGNSLPLAILWPRLDDFRLVGDDEMRRAMVTLLETTRLLAEGAGAASLAAAWQMRDELAGRKVGIVLSGGNVTIAGLAEALAQERPL